METSIQKKLFGHINESLPSNLNLSEVLAELLEVSTDSAYRRIRCETALTIDDLVKICNYFKISFDSIAETSDSKTVTFNYNPMTSEMDYLNYLTSIRNDMRRIASVKNKQIIYAAEDIPLFHHFRLPDLGSFKIFYWLHSVVNDEKYRNLKFHRDIIPDSIKEVFAEIYDLYSRIPSVEIWSDVTAVSLFKQIDYIWQAGIFENKEEALHVVELAHQEFKEIKNQAARSNKSNLNSDEMNENEVNFTLYLSDIEIGNNTIFVTIENFKTLYLTHNTLNKITTANRSFCDETERWLKNLISKSTLLSGVGEKQRFQFFKKNEQQLIELADTIKKSDF